MTKGPTYEIFAQRAGPVYWYFTSSPPAISPTFLGGKLYVSCIGCPGWYSGTGYGADFVFATFVTTGTVQAPTLAVDASSPRSFAEGPTPAAPATVSKPPGAASRWTPNTGTAART